MSGVANIVCPKHVYNILPEVTIHIVGAIVI